MKKAGLAIVTCLVSCAALPAPLLAAEEPAGKIVILKGKAERTSAGAAKAARLKEGAPIFAGDTIATMADAHVKLVLKDESEIVLPSSSKFTVESFSKEEKKPNVLSVFVGSLRAKVTKSASGDTKMLVKTPSATMGVRGTDFQAIYNEKTKMTSLVTFEGSVAMAKLDSPSDATPNKMLDALRDQSKTVVVSEGQFSGIAPAQTQPTVPVKISPAQLASIKNATFAAGPPAGAASAAAAGAPKMMSPVPPGIDAKLVTGTLEEFRAMYGKTAGAEAFEPAGPEGAFPGAPAPPPEGFYDASSGRMAPPAGGFIDLNTGLYIPPPPGSAFDPIAGVFVPPPNMGSFNPDSGAYIPPTGFTLDPAKGFVPIEGPRSGAGPFPPGAAPPAGAPAEAGHEHFGMVFAGMNAKDFGADMTAAPPPPGMDPGMFMGTGGPGEFPPGAFPPGAGPEFHGGYYPGGNIPYYDGPQPNFPVYNPYLCPPYCDPEHQPGGPVYDPNSPTTSATTGVTFVIN
ncbi:MAG: FecR domain-containing protein [Deltaproteobacteria bacterium]|nr:FecR domain-containing protein [Deltaproteobacteria bacterium]